MSRSLSDSHLTAPSQKPAIPCTATMGNGKPCNRFAMYGTKPPLCKYHRTDRPCPGTTKAGEPCKSPAMNGQDTCWNHGPDGPAKRERKPRAQQCTAVSGKTGKRCAHPAIDGATVCRSHGGQSRRVRQMAARRTEEAKARSALKRIGEPVPVANALLALQKHAGGVEAFRDLLWESVSQIDVDKWRYESAQNLEQIHGLVTLFERAQDRCTVTLSALARVQVDDRLAAIHEATLLMLLSALRDALAKAGLDTDTASRVKADFAKRVRVIEGVVAENEKPLPPPHNGGKYASQPALPAAKPAKARKRGKTA